MAEHKFPKTRVGLTRKVNACGFDLYLTVNAQPSGEPGELFVKIGKQGSTVAGLMQAFAVTVSAALQRGVLWSELREKYIGSTFEPRNQVNTSIIDAVAQNVDEMVAILREKQDEQRGQKHLDFEE